MTKRKMHEPEYFYIETKKMAIKSYSRAFEFFCFYDNPFRHSSAFSKRLPV